MPAVLAALNQAALYESTTGLHVDVVVVPDELFYRVLSMGMVNVFIFNHNHSHMFFPVGCSQNL